MEQQQKWKDSISGINYKCVKPQIGELPFQVREAINTLRGNIQLSGYDLKVISITSAMENEGKSSIAFQLARSLAALNKTTLYLDCDIRNSKTMSRYQIDQTVNGLSEFLCGRVVLNDILYRTGNQYLDMIFTGAVAPNPSELVSGPVFAWLLEEMKKHYDYVIVDTPPVNPVIDGALISQKCDGTVLVVESGETERVQAIRAKRQLEYAGIKILGVVLNKVDISGKGYGKYGKYGYGKYGYGEYGYGEKKTDTKAEQKTDKGKKKS